jgi:hypothetical protein
MEMREVEGTYYGCKYWYLAELLSNGKWTAKENVTVTLKDGTERQFSTDEFPSAAELHEAVLQAMSEFIPHPGPVK